MIHDTHPVPLTPAEVAFEIRYALGQAPSMIYVTIRGKDRGKADAAIDQLTRLVAERFAKLEVFGRPPIKAHGDRR